MRGRVARRIEWPNDEVKAQCHIEGVIQSRRGKRLRTEEEGWEEISAAENLVDNQAASQLEMLEVRQGLSHLLKEVDSRELEVLGYRLGDELTLVEASKLMGVTKERVRQIQRRAERRLRDTVKGKGGEL